VQLDVDSVYRYLDPMGLEMEEDSRNNIVPDFLKAFWFEEKEEFDERIPAMIFMGVALARLLVKKGFITEDELDNELRLFMDEL